MKAKKIIKRIAIIILILLATLLSAAVALVLWWNSDSPRDFSGDAAFIVETVEEVHPIFIIEGMLPDYYEDFRAEFLSVTANPMTRADFNLATTRYLSALHDGHMAMGFGSRMLGGMQLPLIPGEVLQTRFVASNSRLFLADQPHIEVLAIGGTPVADIFYQIDRYHFSENESDRQFNYGLCVGRKIILQRAGADFNSQLWNTYADLTINENGQVSTLPIRFSNPLLEVPGFLLGGVQMGPDYIIRYEMIDDVFFISLRTFVDGDHITEVAQAIEQAVASGTRKFIVDLRGNGGGDSAAGSRLLEAMGITIPNFGATRRISDLAEQHRPWVFEWIAENYDLDGLEYITFDPSVQYTANPNGVFVSVLTDAQSYSSATMMTAWVQDGGLGNVIGQPSRNNPSPLGDMLPVTLPDSGLVFAVSYTRFLRPDASADQITLWPDIIVPAEDALNIAVEFLRDLEVND